MDRRVARGESCVGPLRLQVTNFYSNFRLALELVLTRGLGIASNPTSANLNPQETTNQDAPVMGLDGSDLSCPGSSVVADVAGTTAAVADWHACRDSGFHT